MVHDTLLLITQPMAAIFLFHEGNGLEVMMNKILDFSLAISILIVSQRLAIAQSASFNKITNKEASIKVRHLAKLKNSDSLIIQATNASIAIKHGGYTYLFDKFDSRVFGFDAHDKFKAQVIANPTDYNDLSLISKMLPQSNLLIIAKEQIRRLFPGWQRMNQIIMPKPYFPKETPRFIPVVDFHFNEVYPNGAKGSSLCVITLSTLTGNIFSYIHWDTQDIISSTPMLTPSEAMSCAMNTLFSEGTPIAVDELGFTVPDRFGNQRLIYKLRISGTIYRGNKNAYLGIFVDANTGEALSSDILQGIPDTKKSSKFLITNFKRVDTTQNHLQFNNGEHIVALSVAPLLLDDQPYLPFNCLQVGSKMLVVTQGKVTFKSKLGVVELQRGYYQFTLNGITHHSELPVRIVNERMYVPLSIYSEATGNRAEYDSKTRTIIVYSNPR